MNQNQINLLVYSILYLILIILSFSFSCVDMAYGCVSLTKLETQYKKKKSKAIELAIKFVKNYDQTISTIILCNDLVNVALEIISVPFSTSLLAVCGVSDTSLVTLITILISGFTLVFLILFGDILPKSLGKIASFRITIFFGYIICFFYYLFFPITFIVKWFIAFITYPIRKNVKDTEISDDELQIMVDEIEESGDIDEDKAEMLRGTIDYANTLVYEIMTPRVDVYAIEINDDIDEILANKDTFLHSRIPVYEDSIDNIVGFVLSKTLIRLKLENSTRSIKDIVLPIKKFPRSTEINDVFKCFKKEKIHFGVVLDEYGGTEGIVSLEDILEEIVGEIWDETDDVESPYIEQKDGTFIVDGGMNLFDFFELFSLDEEDLDKTEYVTIGGFCIELLDDKFAKVGDLINYQNLNIKVIAVDKNNTIEKLLINVVSLEN